MNVPCALVLSIMLGPLYVHFVHYVADVGCEAHCAHSHLIRAHLCQYFLLKHTVHYVHCPDTICTIHTICIISIIRIIRAHCNHSHLIRTHLFFTKAHDTSRTRTAFQLLYSNAHCAQLMSESCAH